MPHAAAAAAAGRRAASSAAPRRPAAARGGELGDLEELPALFRAARLSAPPDALPGALVRWYGENRRLLPWRGDAATPPAAAAAAIATAAATAAAEGAAAVASLRGLSEAERCAVEARRVLVPPYWTLVSEVMLQQTRVSTVVEFFNRWVRAFPTVEALAGASEAEVNAHWAGLGYYRRARMLHAAAKKISGELGGVFPADVAGLLEIPGVGEYTAGAVASIAFQRAVPLVDGNVVRVFSRLLAVRRDAKDKAVSKGCWALARELVPAERPGCFNQALMELGATVCTPVAPRCGECPVRAWCRAHAEHPGDEAGFPLKTKKKAVPEFSIAVAVLHRERRGQPAERGVKRVAPEMEYLLVKRPETGLLADQWEFINVEIQQSRAESEGEGEDEGAVGEPPRGAQCAPQLSLAGRRSRVDERLRSDHALALWAPCHACVKASARSDCGTFSHNFSHRRHHLFVESVALPAPAECAQCSAERAAPAAGARVTWATQDEMAAFGLTKSTRSSLELVLAGGPSGAKLSQRKRAKADTAAAVKGKRPS
jgi:A/G-specific adenine glycosylase